jgi:predicted RNase H-like HicB family nuclease
MKEIIFILEEDPEGGFSARSLGFSIFTQGNTIDEIKKNIKDAVRCHFGRTKVTGYFFSLVKIDQPLFHVPFSLREKQIQFPEAS